MESEVALALSGLQSIHLTFRSRKKGLMQCSGRTHTNTKCKLATRKQSFLQEAPAGIISELVNPPPAFRQGDCFQ